MSADPLTLRRRLIEVLAMDANTTFTKEAARDAIEGERIHGAVCARIPEVGGRIATFEQFFTVCFLETLNGKPWQPKAKK